VRLLQTQSDERLALLARHGHDFAFEELVRRYREPLGRYLRRLLGDPLAAGDALERGLMNAWATLLRGSTPIEVRPWIYGMAHGAAVTKIAARAKLRPELVDRDEAEARALAADLTPRQRSALVMAVRGYEPDAAVRSMGIHEGLIPKAAECARAAARGAATALVPSRAVLAYAAPRA
jgi:DNA-directed RNA polymerase specialized sigma24 family protein